MAQPEFPTGISSRMPGSSPNRGGFVPPEGGSGGGEDGFV